MAHHSPAVIEAHQISKRYTREYALDRIDLSIAGGSVTAILGPNGAGKTTLLRILATLTKPTSGRILIKGYSSSQNAPTIRRYIGVVSHQVLLYGRLTAAENLHLFAKLYGIPSPEKRIDDCLRSMGLAHLAGELTQTLSRGSQQRLAVSRAILHRPDILLLDEPYTGLDRSAVHLLDDLLLSYHAQGKTILLTTHDVTRLNVLQPDILILDRGQIARFAAHTELQGLSYQNFYEEVIAAEEKNRP